MFRDEDLELDIPAQRRAVRFLIDGGIKEGTGVLLAGGAAGDFTTMTLAERAKVAETIVAEANGEIGVVMGAQTTSTRELVELVRTAAKVGAEFVQVSAPFYFSHTEEDFYEYLMAAGRCGGRRHHSIQQPTGPASAFRRTWSIDYWMCRTLSL